MPTLVQAIATIKAGRRAEGRAMLEQILARSPRDINALLWMTEVSDVDAERRNYLNQILAIDPNHPVALKGVKQLESVSEIPEPKSTLVGAPLVEESEATKKCPYCAETIKADALVCRFCGRTLASSLKPKPTYSPRSRMLVGIALVIVMIMLYNRFQVNVEANLARQRALYGYAAEDNGLTIIGYGTMAVGAFGVVMFLTGLVSELNKSSEK